MDIKFIRNFMVIFGLLSSVFDYLTLARYCCCTLSQSSLERAGLGSRLSSASLVVLVVRTRKPIFTSKPEKYLFAATLATIGVTLIIPWIPLAALLGFQPLPLSFVLVLGAIVAIYFMTADIVKKIFYKHVKF